MVTCAVATADPELLEQVLATAAAAAVEPTVVANASGLRPLWSSAAVVVIGLDLAAAAVEAGLTRRPEVYVVGVAADHRALCAISGPLGAAVVVLPDAAGWLTASMAAATQQRDGRGRLVGVLGGSGGVGASTWAAGLAVWAAAQDVRTVVVDADPFGGGLDLLLGAERVSGWRWPRLAGARGHLGDLSAQLPSAAGVDVLSVGRSEPGDPGPPGAEQLRAVLGSLARSHEFVVVDLPRSPDWIARHAQQLVDLLVLVVRADVRGVSAARTVLERVLEGPAPVTVVRARRTAVITAAAVADGLALSLLGVVPDDDAVRLAAERGAPPPRSGRAVATPSWRAALENVLARERRAA